MNRKPRLDSETAQSNFWFWVFGLCGAGAVVGIAYLIFG